MISVQHMLYVAESYGVNVEFSPLFSVHCLAYYLVFVQNGISVLGSLTSIVAFLNAYFLWCSLPIHNDHVLMEPGS